MIVAFVPVRGGSKSIPLKNIKLFCGKPLVYWVLKALEDTPQIDKIVVATDSKEIKKTVQNFQISKMFLYDRDPENASDTSSTESVMLEYLNKQDYQDKDLFLLVQATSPLTTSKDFQEAIAYYFSSGCDSLLSCSRIKRFFWNEEGTPINYDFRCRPRRQDFKGILVENGAFYINRIGNIKRDKNRLSGKINIYEMSEYCSIELDEPPDWLVAEYFMKKHNLKADFCFDKIKLLILDVDGVLTDAGMYYSEKGDELKKFNTHDGKGIELLRQRGIQIAIITSENTNIVFQRAKKLHVDYLFQGVEDKLVIVNELCKNLNLSLEDIAYIGDDFNDIEVIKRVGYSACPNNAIDAVKANVSLVLSKKGGEGAVREFCDLFINSINQYPKKGKI